MRWFSIVAIARMPAAVPRRLPPLQTPSKSSRLYREGGHAANAQRRNEIAAY
jgi:hypothetical protein